MTHFGQRTAQSKTAIRKGRAQEKASEQGFTPKQERVYGRMFQAIEQIGHRLEKTEEQRDVLVERLENLESQAELDSLTGKYYLPVKSGGIDASNIPSTPKWITATSIASVFIAVIALGVVMTKEPTLSKEQIAALQLNPPQFANLNPQSPYWEKLDLSQGEVSPKTTVDVKGRPDDRQLASVARSSGSDPLIESILESLENQEGAVETTDIEPSELAQSDRYIELFEDESLSSDAPDNVENEIVTAENAQESETITLTDLEPASGEEPVSEAVAAEVAKLEVETQEVTASPAPEPKQEERVEVAAVQTKPAPAAPAVKKVADVQPRKTYTLQTVKLKGIPSSLSADSSLPEKVKSLEARAFEGIPEAQHDLATLYAAGSSVPLDYKRAVYWFYQSAQGGIANAHYNLGVMSHQGLGLEQNLEQALIWYKNAAELGHPEALYNLGIAYIEGIGTSQDIERGAGYFKRAAHSGVSQAAYNLGILYESSFMGGVDKSKAQEWYLYAAETGHQDARQAFERLSGATFVNSYDTSPVSLANKIEPAAGGLTDADRNRIVEIQQHLIARNLLPGEPDGVYGPRTQDAIRSYQSSAGLPVTGRPSETLLDHMRGQVN